MSSPRDGAGEAASLRHGDRGAAVLEIRAALSALGLLDNPEAIMRVASAFDRPQDESDGAIGEFAEGVVVGRHRLAEPGNSCGPAIVLVGT